MAISLIVFLEEKPKVYSINQPPRSSIEHLFNWEEGVRKESNFFFFAKTNLLVI